VTRQGTGSVIATLVLLAQLRRVPNTILVDVELGTDLFQ
jgi:hypothetical protein